MLDEMIFLAGKIAPRTLVITELKKPCGQRSTFHGCFAYARVKIMIMLNNLLRDILPRVLVEFDVNRLWTGYEPIVNEPVLKIVMNIADTHQVAKLLGRLGFELRSGEHD
jgi:hypothetical protein